VEREEFTPGLLLVGGEVTEADQFVEDEGEGEGVADWLEEEGFPADGEGEEAGGEEGEKEGGEHPPGGSAVEAEQTEGDFHRAGGKEETDARVENPVGETARGFLVFGIHDGISKRGTF
jgi:6-phosphogluconate dehydrogenase